EEEVAGIPRLDAHQVAGLAERGDGVAQDQFDHHGTPSSGARRRRKSSQVSAVPISTQDAKANGNSASAVMESSTAKNIGAGRRAVWMTASPRPAYNASIRTSRLLPTTPAAVWPASIARAAAMISTQTRWSLNRSARNGSGAGPSGVDATRQYQ